MSGPVIIEAAMNGVTGSRRNAHVPITPEEQAKDALACVDAGATVIHTHAPNIAVPPDEAADQYAIAFRPVVEQHPGVVCYPTTGIGSKAEPPPERRQRPTSSGPAAAKRSSMARTPATPAAVG